MRPYFTKMPEFGRPLKEAQIKRTEENVQGVAAYVRGQCERSSLRCFDASAIGRLVEHSSRMVDDQRRLSANMASFLDIVRGLQLASDFLSQYEAFEFLNDPIPIIDVSFNDLLAYAEDLGLAVEEFQRDPAGSLQSLEGRLEAVLGIDGRVRFGPVDLVFQEFHRDDDELAIAFEPAITDQTSVIPIVDPASGAQHWLRLAEAFQRMLWSQRGGDIGAALRLTGYADIDDHRRAQIGYARQLGDLLLGDEAFAQGLQPAQRHRRGTADVRADGTRLPHVEHDVLRVDVLGQPVGILRVPRIEKRAGDRFAGVVTSGHFAMILAGHG